VSRFHGGVSPLVGLLSRNNKSTRYAANLQTAQTPDSVIAPDKPGAIQWARNPTLKDNRTRGAGIAQTGIILIKINNSSDLYCNTPA
ncbi:MAG: hypothetical protein P8N14_16040, partial [Sulfitobacter sp.]|nr:hypothetical protein [Sulfitobacter sp.]